MTRIRAPPNLPELVRAAFNRAKSSGDVNFYPTQAAILHVNSIPFQLRFSPALASKPKAAKPALASSSSSSSSSQPPPFDPFADPPPSLIIAKLDPPDHILVLNKFAIVPEHFILATASFAPQTHLLTPADLGAARACIDAYKAAGDGDGEGGGRRLFVFFNSGEHSGASQPHRHLQLLPVDRMRDGLPEPEESGWEVLADVLGRRDCDVPVPFRCFVERLTDYDHSDDTLLHAAYLRLYRRACEAVLGMNVEEKGEGEEGEEARISYNLAMTGDVMVLCPRRSEGGPVVAVAAHGGKGEEEVVVGRLALNGTVLAGTALVKSQAEWDALRADPGQLARVLARI